MATQRGKSFAADMKSAPVAGPPKPKARSPFVDYDEAGNVRNPAVQKKSPDATMQKGRPVPNARPVPGTLPGVTGDFMRAGAQTLADTYHLGDKPLPWQKGGKKKGGK